MKVERSTYDIISDIVSILCIVGVILYLALTWDKIPNKIPGHYNLEGKVDRITSKNSIIVLSIMTIMMYLLMSIIQRVPQIWNTGGIKITEKNERLVYRTSKDLLVSLKMIVVIIFSYLNIYSTLGRNLPMAFTPITLLMTFGTIIYFIFKLLRINKN